MKYKCTLAVVPLILALNLTGDTVELKTGERIEGVVRQSSTTGVVIEIAGQAMTFPMDKVQAIYYGAATPRHSAESSLDQEVLDALQGLRSVTESGISYRDYAPRVLDAKVKVDRYLGTRSNAPAELRSAVRSAMYHYELASQAWSASISNSAGALSAWITIGRALDADPQISTCPEVRRLIGELDQGSTRMKVLRYRDVDQRFAMIGLSVGKQPGVLWKCASVKVAEAVAKSSPSSVPQDSEQQPVALSEGDQAPAAAVAREPEAQGKSELPKRIVVRFTSTPPDAEVKIDGEYWGHTPTADLPKLQAGSHTIVVKKLGYQPWERKITLAPGDDRTISADLELQPNDPSKPHIVGN